jgi:hypothetical protein
MTLQPVMPSALLLVIAVLLIAIRLITMRQAHTTAGAQWATVWRWCGVTLAVLLVLIAAARPGLEPSGQQAAASAASGQNVNVFFLVDRSADSGVADYAGKPRIDGIRADIGALIDRYPRARFAMISFASRASLDWPLSEDVWSLQPVVMRLEPYSDAEVASEADAGAAANTLRYQLIAAGQQYRDSTNLVFYFGCGASGSGVPQGDFEPVPGTLDGGAAFGYGTPSGDSPAFDERRLELIATQLGVPYVHRQPGEPLPHPAAQANSAGTQHTEDPGVYSNVVARTELYWVFTLPAAVLLLFELFLTVREYRRTRMAHRSASP